MSKYKLYIKDILRSIDQIEKSLKSKTRNYFEKDIDMSEATAMRLQIIGESIKKLPNSIKRQNPEIDWDSFIKFRNIISHVYFKIDKDILWDIIKNEIPKLKITMKRIEDEQ